MTKDEILNGIKEEFGKKVKNIFEKSYNRIFITIDPKDVTAFVKYIFVDLEARFNTASCVDQPDTMEILYHFMIDRAGIIISFRTTLDKKDLVVDSITPIMKGAEWIEREIHELFGVDFRNHPNLKPLLLPDHWPKGVYPLRRDYKEEDYESKVKENY